MAADTELALLAYGDVAAGCTSCALAEGRTQVVFGSGSPAADLMFVGEAPGFHEDKQGVPFVGAAGKLLSKLLEGIGMSRDEVYIANVLKCLRYNAPVQLGDGSWERIGRLVRSRYSGEVMSVDDQGNLVAKRVTGWHETPLGGRRVFKLTFASAKRAGVHKSGVQLTGDHPVLTKRGYVPVEALTQFDAIATGVGLSDVEFDVVVGSLLGDASLNAASSSVQMAHSDRQRDYAAFKAELLDRLGASTTELRVAAVSGGHPAYGAVHVRTRADRALRVLRSDFYSDRKRVPGWLAGELNDRMLAVWFLDDGYTHIREGRQPLSEIATNGFAEEDRRTLLNALARLDLPAKSSRGRLYFDAPTTRALSERIAPYVPTSMRYKLHPEVEGLVPFDPSRFEHSARRVIYDRVEVIEVTERPRTDTTFFCLDVEDTHNFVTAGGVVHNCRPPGNRDPLPDEIASCEPHLFKQIELIQPKLIATLGNFSTKLLSGKPNGITQVHGREQKVTLGGMDVTLFPIFHPAAALYTPRMLEVLETDFRRIPELLGREVAPPPPPEPVVDVQPVQLGLF